MPTEQTLNFASLEAMASPSELRDITPDQFHSEVVTGYKPVVIRQFASQWPIVQSGQQAEQDTAAYLAELCADKPIKMVRLPADTGGRMFYSDDLRGMNFQVAETSMQQGLKLMATPPDDGRLCVQCVAVNEHFPRLKEALPNALLPSVNPFIWLGNGITVAPHFDEANNLAVVCTGKRRFTLFPPEQVKNLYVGPLDYTPAGQPISLVDLRAPDLEKFPRYKEAYQHGLSVELNPGDAIFIPTPWWHHVESLSPFNALINYWWSKNYVASALPFPMLMHTLQSLHSMPEQEQAAWKAILQHYLSDDKSAVTGHIPNNAKGILDTPSEQTTRLIHQWLAAQIR